MKSYKPYFTTYPRLSWYWFNEEVYKNISPRIGNLPTDLFNLLKSKDGDSARYGSECEAMEDLRFAMQTKDQV